MTSCLRALTLADLDAAVSLHASGFADAWSAASIAGLMGEANVLSLGWEEGGVLLAFALFQSVAGESELLTIATDPQHRGRGIAGRLIGAAMEALAAEGNTRLMLDVAEDNTSARRLYERLGFTQDGRRPRYYTAGRPVPVDGVLMSRPLAGEPLD